MKRRNVLKIIAGLAGGAVIIPSGLYVLSPGLKKYAEQKIHKELSYLNLDSSGVTKFVNDYFAAPPTYKDNIKWKVYYYLNTSVYESDNLFEMVRAYLLASDFFLNKMDVSKPVHYLGLFDAYKSPVPNPFSYINT